jgi:hypothetical protein
MATLRSRDWRADLVGLAAARLEADEAGLVKTEAGLTGGL